MYNDLLLDRDYRAIFEEPSVLEAMFAVYGNCLELDERGEIARDAEGHGTGNQRAYRRVGQYIRRFIDPGYVVEPPFEAWETELP